MNPVYRLSEVEYRPPTPPKFIRDQITNEDIDGAKPKKTKYYETRNIMNVNDIEGTKGKKTYVRQTSYDSFNYNDITKTKFVTNRSVNPLNPSYMVRNDQGQLVDYGEIPGSSPKRQFIRSKGEFFGNLEVRDIPGTAVGSTRVGVFKER